MAEFSFRTREEAVQRFKQEQFDLLIIGGGITGAGVARDAVRRGLKVALVERKDFAFGTSSRSSKLIHGGLRYLENLELGLVFEALSERSLLLKTVPNMVRPLPFYLPVYAGDKHGKGILGLGLWLYDLLAVFRSPEFHKNLSKKAFLREFPFLKSEGLKGGFKYYDASMWDDALAVETLRAASGDGAAVANYIEALRPVWEGDRICGFHVRDVEKPEGQGDFAIRAHRVVVCTGPWTDIVGGTLSPDWKPWLNPSKGVHLIFDLKRIPVPGTLVMMNDADGRISFVIPRPDYGAGVVIVGTTDSPTSGNPDHADVSRADVDYILALMNRYLPALKLSREDVVSAYVGVRPLFASAPGESLQKVSREHHIDTGPGGTVVVAGGKYTTHRKMAEEIVDYTLELSRNDSGVGVLPPTLRSARTKEPINPATTIAGIAAARDEAKRRGINLPEALVTRYGGEALAIVEESSKNSSRGESKSPEGFPCLESQLRHEIRSGMVMHLEDFYLRRVPLFAARKDHGMPFAEALAKVWAEERGKSDAEAFRELELLEREVKTRSLVS